jgi:hypothetical protein
MYRAKMAIDADGSPRAYGPNDSGLDYTANAGYPGNWWGVITDASGNPIVQSSSDPYPGLWVSTTSLVDNAYSSTKTQHYTNSETIPFFVIPSAVKSLAGISIGDMGYVYNTTNGKGCYAILADIGPSGKLGEASMYVASQLGINNNPRTGGTSSAIIDYVIFPGSGYGQGTIPTVSQINSAASAKLNAAGGSGLTSCIPAIEPPAELGNRIGAQETVTQMGEAVSLGLYPNPFDGLTLHGKIYSEENSMQVKIYDITGREIFSTQVSVAYGEFSLSFDEKLSNGVYLFIGILNEKKIVQRVMVR